MCFVWSVLYWRFRCKTEKGPQSVVSVYYQGFYYSVYGSNVYWNPVGNFFSYTVPTLSFLWVNAFGIVADLW